MTGRHPMPEGPREGPTGIPDREDGRIERVTENEYTGPPAQTEDGAILLYRLTGDRWNVAKRADLDAGFGSKPLKRTEVLRVIPESAHYSEIERLAGELEARAEDWSPENQDDSHIYNTYREAASLLRDSVQPDSLTRGES